MLGYVRNLKKWWLGNKTSNTNKSNEQLSLLLWGCNDFSTQLYKILKENDLDVIAFIDSSGISTFCDKPVFTPLAFKNNPLYSSLPIVIASAHTMVNDLPTIDFESVRQFTLKIQEIAAQHGIENELLHPAALVDFLPVRYPNRIIPFGLPGTGITLFSNICHKICENYPNQFLTQNHLAIFFERMCHEYTECIHQLTLTVGNLVEGFDIHVASWKIGNSFVVYNSKRGQIRIYSFRTRNHIINPVYGYHQIPTEKLLNTLHILESKLFFCIRNPLDIILSILNKMTRIGKDNQQIKMDDFCNISRAVINQLNLYHALSNKMMSFSYDDLINNPIDEICLLMKKLEIKPSQAVARQIWEQLSFKQLPSAPTQHFWSGGSGKWESYFKPEHLSFLKNQGIEEILKRYHYPSVLEQFKNLSANVSEHQWESYCEESLLDKLNSPLNILFDDHNQTTTNFLVNKHGQNNYTQASDLHITCPDPELREKMKDIYGSQYVNKLASAGAHSRFRVI